MLCKLHLNNTIQKNPWVKEEVSKEIKTLNRMKMKMQHIKRWDTAKIALREKWTALMHSLDKRKSLKSVI